MSLRWFKRKKKKPLTAKGVSFSYNKQEVLRDLNLTVPHNQILAVVGKSGEGKSTFLNLIVGVLTKGHEGKIKILGRNSKLAKKDIGYVPQELAYIPDLSIRENMTFFGNLNGIRHKKALESGKSLMKTLQLEVGLERTPNSLSGGQKVRLNILLSLLHKPKILILDEPFVGLDYFNRKLLWHFLQYQKNRKKTVILTTHMLTEAQNYSDRIVILSKGKVLAKGSFEEISKKLNFHYIVEIKIKYLSKTKEEALKKYCDERKIMIMDAFNNYYMFSVDSQGQRNYLLRFLQNHGLEYEETAFRKPNLDEMSLKVTTK